jgi:amidophosphoribosyltransferase
VKPGEAILIENGDLSRVKIAKGKRVARCVFEYIYFARPDSILDGVSVYKSRYEMGKRLAEEGFVDCDLVSPVPDSGTTCAIGFSSRSGIPYMETLIKNRYVGRTFIMPEQKIRELSVRIKLNIVRENVEGRRVLLVDDSIVRGTTSKKIVELVRSAGAKEVHFRVGSPPIIAPCYFGINMSTREELIASDKSVDEIRGVLKADSLHYLSLEGLIKSVGFRRCELCLACLTGVYPVEVPGERCEL